MVLTYGEKEIVSFTYNKEVRKLVVEVKEPVLDDGIVISCNRETLVYRRDDFEAALEEFMPEASGMRAQIETVAKARMEQVKQNRKAAKENQ